MVAYLVFSADYASNAIVHREKLFFPLKQYNKTNECGGRAREMSCTAPTTGCTLRYER